MTESQFINENKEDWKALETYLSSHQKDADELNRLFVKVSSDLSYARTYYPKRMVRVYLNELTQKVFDSINRREERSVFKELAYFFSTTLPLEIQKSKNALIISFTVFIIALLIGIVSSANSLDFVQTILGEAYVSMTEDNINNGDPMAVYKDKSKMDMVVGITLNNIKVAFFAFVLGLIGSLGSVIILLFNGIMVGAFQYFFYSKGLFLTSFLTIWIHGTIEISAIIVAGAAGIVLGNGILFPSTFYTSTSLKVSAKRAIRILLSTIPLFIIAGILESYVTRLTEMPVMIKWFIILGSLALIVFIYIVYPFFLFKGEQKQEEIDLYEEEDIDLNFLKLRNLGQINQDSFAQFRAFIPLFFTRFLPLLLLFFIPFLYYHFYSISFADDFTLSDIYIAVYESFRLPIGLFLFGGFYVLSVVLVVYFKDGSLNLQRALQCVKQFGFSLFIAILPVTILVQLETYWFWFGLIVIGPQWTMIMLGYVVNDESLSFSKVVDAYKSSFEKIGRYLIYILLLVFIGFMLNTFINTSIFSLVSDFVSWHNIFENRMVTIIWFETLMHSLVLYLMFVLGFVFFSNINGSNLCSIHSADLLEKVEDFEQKLSI